MFSEIQWQLIDHKIRNRKNTERGEWTSVLGEDSLPMLQSKPTDVPTITRNVLNKVVLGLFCVHFDFLREPMAGITVPFVPVAFVVAMAAGLMPAGASCG